MWEIKQNNQPSYLFGTMHVKDNRAFGGIQSIQECILSCDAFAAEFDLQEADPNRLMEVTVLPAGQSLEQLLNPKVYQKLVHIVQRETGQSLGIFNYRSPLLLFNLISAAQFQTDNNLALDDALYQFAQNQGKQVLGLETFQAQLDVFGKIDLKDQTRALKKVATNFAQFRKALKRSSELYIKGDIQQLLKKTKRSIGSMRRILLYDRNITMANSFERIEKEQSLFAAVGAGHLAGDKGVLALLKRKGYQVRPVYYS